MNATECTNRCVSSLVIYEIYRAFKWLMSRKGIITNLLYRHISEILHVGVQITAIKRVTHFFLLMFALYYSLLSVQ
jgi:heterodisulfide reductase subunit C